MVTQKITLQNPERFSGTHTIAKAKLEEAAAKALERLKLQYDKYGAKCPGCSTRSEEHIYFFHPRNLWCDGLCNGMFWLAYQMTGDKFYREAAESQFDYFKKRYDEKICLQDHDVGFVYSPSFVAGYKITGNEQMKQIAIDAAEYFYNQSYSQKGGFIIRQSLKADTEEGCRTMMDTMMNIPLLFWTSEMTGDDKYKKAALSQCDITANYLIREDGSSNHHYIFDPATHKPLRGITLQGHSDDSCWSRGHAWGIYGFPVAYGYAHDEGFIKTHKKITHFMLNHLPDDYIPYWDYDFTCGNTPRDSSAAAISLCGMLEMAKHLPDSDADKAIYHNAALHMLEALIDNCTEPPTPDADGILFKTCGSLPHCAAVSSSAMYGNYFYIEALMRLLNPDWEMHW